MKRFFTKIIKANDTEVETRQTPGGLQGAAGFFLGLPCLSGGS